MSDYPFDEVMKMADEVIKHGADIHQKFTCAKCGARQTMEEKNKFYTSGHCEECGHITDLVKQGCNFLLVKDFKR